MSLTAVGNTLQGTGVNGSPGWSHWLTGTLYGPSASTVVVRRDASGCVTRLYVHLTLVSQDTLRAQTTGSDGFCGLPTNFQEDFYYSRL